MTYIERIRDCLVVDDLDYDMQGRDDEFRDAVIAAASELA